MSLSHLAIAKTDDLPIRHEGNVHSGKVRSVYWLTADDSARLCEERGYSVAPGARLAVMVISDRISAYEIIWQGEDGLSGVPSKGAALNAAALHWFDQFEQAGLAGSHVLESPHPLVWIVQKAPDGLENGQKLDELLITPSTKGILTGVPGVPEKDDVDVSREQILNNYEAFAFRSAEDVSCYEKLLAEGFQMISKQAESAGQLLVDTKFEFGYVPNASSDGYSMIYIDEVGTLDSSRYWEKSSYTQGKIVENSKEMFRKFLCNSVPDADVLLNKERMDERDELGKSFHVPVDAMMEVSELYKKKTEEITGKPVPEVGDARQEILDALAGLGLVE